MDASIVPLCDKCGHLARETWQHHRTGCILIFCVHHSRQHQVALFTQGFRLVEASRG